MVFFSKTGKKQVNSCPKGDRKLSKVREGATNPILTEKKAGRAQHVSTPSFLLHDCKNWVNSPKHIWVG